MKHTVTGRIKAVTPVEKVGAKSHPKQTVVLSVVNGNYEDLYALEAFGQDRVKEVSRYRVGQDVKVEFGVRGREYQGRYYTNLSLISIAVHQQEMTELPPEQTYDDSGIDDAEDVPF